MAVLTYRESNRRLSLVVFRFGGDQRGFSVVEVLVSMTILAVIGVTFVTALGTGYKVLTTSDQRTTAESLAKAQLENIVNAPYDGTAPYNYDSYLITGIPAGYGVSIAVALVDPRTGNVSTTDLGVQKVTVTVTCQQHSPSTVVAMEVYKR